MMISPGFDQPALYRITIASHLGEDWTDYLAGMTIDNHCERETCIATLTGRLADQAALLGVLNMLYDSHVIVLAVERLTKDWERIDPLENKNNATHVAGF